MVPPSRNSVLRELARRKTDGSLDGDFATSVRDQVAGLVLSKPQEGLELAEALLDAASGEAGRIEAIAFRCFAEACLYQGRVGDSARSYERASQLAASIPDDGLLGQILVGRIGALSYLGRSQEATALAPQAERLLERTGDHGYLAKLHMNLGNAAFHKQEYGTAFEHYQQADLGFTKLGLADAMTLGLRLNLGIACLNLGRLEEARSIYLLVEQECEVLQLRHLDAQAKFNRAVLEARLGQYRDALSLLESAEEVFRDEGSEELSAATQLTRAEIYVDLGMSDEVIDLADQASRSYRHEEMLLDANLADLAKGRALFRAGRTTEAIDILKRCGKFYEDQGLLVGRAFVELETIRALIQWGDLDDALERAHNALAVFYVAENANGKAQSTTLLAETLRQKNQYRDAEEAIRPILRKTAQLAGPDRISLWTTAARIAREAKNWPLARRRYDKAISEVERHRLLIPGADLRATAFAQGAHCYSESVDLQIKRGRPRFDSLYQTIESARGRRWKDGTVEDQPLEWQVRRAELASLVRKLQRRESGTIESGSESDSETDTLSSSASIRRRIQALEKEILSELRDRSVRSEGKSSRWSPWHQTVNSDTIRSRLGESEVLLEYFVTDLHILVLVFTREEETFHVLETSPKEIESLSQSFFAQVESLALITSQGNPNLAFHRKGTDAVLSRFWSALLAPLDPWLSQAGEITIVPHGALHQVPFECLANGNGYVDERWTLRRLPQIGAILREKSKHTTVSRPDVVLAAIENGPDGTFDEARDISSTLGVSLEQDPDSKRVLQALEASGTVHWCTHGVFRADNPMFSHLAVQDGGLFVADLRGRRFATDRVVLSACNSGRVLAARSDDNTGIAIALLEGGVGELVASQWRVHDQATIGLMTAFHRELQTKVDSNPDFRSSTALRVAMQEVRKEWPHPFFWGGFAVFG